MATWREMTRGNRDCAGPWQGSAGDGSRSQRSLDKSGANPIRNTESGLNLDEPSDAAWNTERQLEEEESAGKRQPGKGVAPHIKGSGG